MKTNRKSLLIFILIVWFSAALLQAQTWRAEKLDATATQVFGVSEAKFSPSGKLLAIQTDDGFFVVPTARLDELTEDPGAANFSWTKGSVKCFLPSGKIVFSTERVVYTLDPQTGKTRLIHRKTADEARAGDFPGDREMVAVSENLIISGSGDYDSGGDRGNILRFDARRGRGFERGPRIDAFYNPLVSPGGKYILFEHGNDDDHFADLYDAARNVNYPLPQRFDLKRHFPKYKTINVEAFAWIAPDKFLASIDENQFEKFKIHPGLEDTAPWLVLFDAAAAKIIWKRQLEETDVPYRFQALSGAKAFFETRHIYEVRLADGKITRLPVADEADNYFFYSPDKTKVAFTNESSVIVAPAITGAPRKIVFRMPEESPERLRLMQWSPDGERLLLFDAENMIIVRLNGDATKENK